MKNYMMWNIVPRFFEGDGGGESAPGTGNGGGDAVSVVGADGAFTEDWHKPYGEENTAYLSRFKNLPDFVNANISARKTLGKNADQLIEIPTDKSSDATIAAFRKARNVPDDITGYKYEKSTDISERVQVDDTQIEAFKNSALKHGLNDKQLNGVLNDYLTSQGPLIEAMDAHMAEQQEAAKVEGNHVLEQLFKTEAPERSRLANAVLDKYGLDPIKMPDGTTSTIKGELLAANPELLASPYMIMLLDKFRGSMSEDSLKGLGGDGGGSVADVEAKIAEIRANPASKDKSHPEYKTLQATLVSLYQKKSA